MITNTIGKVRDKDTVVGSKDGTEGTGYDSTKRYIHKNRSITGKIFVIFPALL